jgi:hypothetical protein
MDKGLGFRAMKSNRLVKYLTEHQESQPGEAHLVSDQLVVGQGEVQGNGTRYRHGVVLKLF